MKFRLIALSALLAIAWQVSPTSAAPTPTSETTVVDEIGNLRDVAVDSAGTIYIADTDYDRILKLTFSNNIPTVTTIAGTGGDVGNHRLRRPNGIAIDADDNLHIADNYNRRVQKVSLDTTGPTASTPTTHTRVGSIRTISFTCADEDSEINTCSATLDGQPVENGDPLPTTTRGTHKS